MVEDYGKRIKGQEEGLDKLSNSVKINKKEQKEEMEETRNRM